MHPALSDKLHPCNVIAPQNTAVKDGGSAVFAGAKIYSLTLNIIKHTRFGLCVSYLIILTYKNDNNSGSSCIKVLGSAIIVFANDLVLGNIRSK